MRVIVRPCFKNQGKIPYNRLLYSAIQQLGIDVHEYSTGALLTTKWDILHIHWPESLLECRSLASAWTSKMRALALMDFVRRRGTKIVWTVHDLQPHEYVYPRIERSFWTAVMRRLSGLIALSETGLRLVRERQPELADLPACVTPHGHFRDAYARTVDRQGARAMLGIDRHVPVVAFFGQIRPYKNVPHLIRVFRQSAPAEAVLLVCGRLNKRADCARDVHAAADGDPRVRLHLRFIDDDEVQTFLSAADLVVCPFTDILNSGSVMLALSFDRPVLVPEIGAMSEVRDDVGADWIRTYRGSLDGAILTDAMRWAVATERSATPPLDHLNWLTIAGKTADFYRRLLEHD